MSQPRHYKRSEIIDEDKESKLLAFVVKLAFEPNSEGWKVDKKNASIQTKTHPISKRPIYRAIIAGNQSKLSNVTLKDMYQYHERGYNQSSSSRVRLQYHIDDDHDILYEKVQDSLASTRDYQVMFVRFKLLKHMSLSGMEYNIVGLFVYDISETHPLYCTPSKNVIRGKTKCRADVYYQPTDTQQNGFTFVTIRFTQLFGGWVPKWMEDSSNYSSIVQTIDLCQRDDKTIPEKLQSRKDNKLMKPKSRLSMVGNDSNENIEHKNEELFIADCKKNEQKSNNSVLTHVIDTNQGFVEQNNNESAMNENPNIIEVSPIYDIDRAAGIAANGIEAKQEYINDENEYKIEIEIESESIKKQFMNFLSRMNMAKYLNKFEENDCSNMASIEFFDNEFLQNEIGMNKILRKRFLKRCGQIKDDMETFKNEYGISPLLYDRLEKYGLVTLNILCNEIKNKNELKKYNIINKNQCEFLWRLIQRFENQNAMEMEGN